MAKLLMPICENSYSDTKGDAHVVRPGYTSINAIPVVSGPQMQGSW